jgi:hypothetical protein
MNNEGGRKSAKRICGWIAQGIEAEFAKRSKANWSGKPDPA